MAGEGQIIVEGTDTRGGVSTGVCDGRDVISGER